MMAEGVARQLNPEANMWMLARPLASQWMRDQASFAKRAEDLFEGAMMLAARLPRILSALEARQEPTPVPVKSSLPFVTTLVVLAVAFAAFFT
jgi:ubiquinone biosynthesis protein